MEKFAFSTDHEKISENLGISDVRHDEIFEAAKQVSLRAYLYDKEITDKSQAIEVFLNQVQPQSPIEMFWAGFVFSDVSSQTERLCEKLSSALKL